MSSVTVQSFGEHDLKCDCGCGQTHHAMKGQALRVAEGLQILFFALMATHGTERHLWLAIGSGPWGTADSRDCFVSVERWVADEQVASRVTDGRESPFRTEPIFDDATARLLDRAEVLAQPGATDWLFGWVTDLTNSVPQFAQFLMAR